MKSKVTNIQYTKTTDSDPFTEVTFRQVIPTFVPVPVPENMKAIDVTALNKNEQEEMVKLLEEYNEYLHQMTSVLFNFEGWLEHTGNDREVKWRTFKLNQTEFLAE